VGILVGHPELISEINKVRLPYNLNALSQRAAAVVLQHWEMLAPEFRTIIAERERLRQSLGRLPGVTVFPSQANFLLVRLDAGAARMWEALAEHGILVRHFPGSARLQNCLRVTIGTPAENTFLATTWQTIVESFQPLLHS
jgi:histidinol-phosphate aminotransferase